MSRLSQQEQDSLRQARNTANVASVRNALIRACDTDQKDSIMHDLFEKSESEMLRDLAGSFQSKDGPDEQAYDLKEAMAKPIESSNIGYQLLLKMGWQQDTPLGKSGKGRLDPIPIEVKVDIMGLGRKELEDSITAPENITRRQLESERVETQELKERREREAQRQQIIKTEVAAITESFYCKLCDKRYKRNSEYEVHLSSYDHNHAQRLAEERKRRAAFTKKKRKPETDSSIINEPAAKRQATETPLQAPGSSASTPQTKAAPKAPTSRSSSKVNIPAHWNRSSQAAATPKEAPRPATKQNTTPPPPKNNSPANKPQGPPAAPQGTIYPPPPGFPKPQQPAPPETQNPTKPAPPTEPVSYPPQPRPPQPPRHPQPPAPYPRQQPIPPPPHNSQTVFFSSFGQ